MESNFKNVDELNAYLLVLNELDKNIEEMKDGHIYHFKDEYGEVLGGNSGINFTYSYIFKFTKEYDYKMNISKNKEFLALTIREKCITHNIRLQIDKIILSSIQLYRMFKSNLRLANENEITLYNKAVSLYDEIENNI